MTRKSTVYAFIPARSGSVGLPHKNILPIAGHPLLAYAIAFGKALGIDRVILSTDPEEYAEIGRHYGAECPYLRGAEASSDTAMEEDILADMEANLPRFGIEMPDIWLRLKPTNPFRKVEDVRRAIDLLEARPDVDSVRHVNASETRLCAINDEGFLEPLISGWPEGRSVIRRTEFPTAYQVFNLDVLRHENLAKLGSGYMGKRVLPIIGDAITGIDINNRDDFDVVKALIEMQPRPEVVAQHLVEPQEPAYQPCSDDQSGNPVSSERARSVAKTGRPRSRSRAKMP
ncbi:cytidylyltransferase domain-containing protein [Vannielia litorea]|uniref:N-acylneuraminate cytidylyltransferase n=1 Tax=Vannielia litorea TaxID=1217970 RepID=A0A1N6GN09_9RHOB|nr:acylneuraminate cytidylyltransferase family protein [Vannielia litorea]SIO08895.1 N-acylneuraminate cytidylyltransferase [Vannielia litorea]